MRRSRRSARRSLQREFGNKKLKDLAQKVLIPTFDLDAHVGKNKVRTSKAKFFHNFDTADGRKDADEKVVDVAMRTSAAPTYFPTYQGYIDGGVVANNPSMAALAQGAKQKLDDIVLLSIGTGLVPQYIAGDHDWGFAQWAKPLVNIMIDGNMGVADYQCNELLGARYMRVVDFLPRDIPLDSLD